MSESREPVRELLKKAYVRLLCRKPYTDITITDLTAEAGVSRVSYYRAFNSFEDIINEISTDIYERMSKDFLPLLLGNSEKYVKAMISGFFVRLKESNIKNFPQENIRFAFSVFSKKLKLESSTSSGIRQKYSPIINVSILLAVARKWALSGFEESEEELSDFVYSAIAALR